MSTKWHLIKYMADPRRREPRNVGLALETPNGWLLKFVGEEKAGLINGQKIRSIHLQKDVYTSWVEYYRRKAVSNRWNDVEQLNVNKPGNFFTELAGEIFETDETATALLQRLYSELVEEPKQLSPSERFHAKIRQVFELAQIEPQEHIRVPAKWTDSGEKVDVEFDFGYQNGQLHVMDAVSISRMTSVLDFKARLDAVERAGRIRSFVAFCSYSQVEDAGRLEEVLRPLEKGARTIDVDNTQNAADTLVSIMGH